MGIIGALDYFQLLNPIKIEIGEAIFNHPHGEE